MDLSNITHNATTGISSVHELEITDIIANPNQPRKSFEVYSLQELGASIKKHGLLEPIVVTDVNNGLYMIVAGERRYRASKMAGLTTIRATIDTGINYKTDSKQIHEKALVENIQRENLTDWEIATEVSYLWDSGDYESKKELAESIGKSQSYISKCFGVLNKLDGYILNEFKKDGTKIGLSVLEEIARIPEHNQVRAYKDYTAGEITRADFKEYKFSYDDGEITIEEEQRQEEEKKKRFDAFNSATKKETKPKKEEYDEQKIIELANKEHQKAFADDELSKEEQEEEDARWRSLEKNQRIGISPEKKTTVVYAFGNINQFGNWLGFCADSDIDGHIKIETEGFVKKSCNANYKITIEEL